MKNDAEIDLSREIVQTRKIIVYGAALWAFAFAVLHFVWAAGFYIFLPEEQASKAFGQRWFLIYDLAAGFLCIIGTVLIFLSANRFGSPRFRVAVKILLIAGTIILVLRAVAGIGKFIYLLFQKQSFSEVLAYWDLWFCLGAGLFAASLWQIKYAKKTII